jgi:hypothetical protein
MTSRTWAFAFAFAFIWTVALADGKPAITSAEEARAMIGMEYTASMPGERIAPDRFSCINEGGAILLINGISQNDWSTSTTTCQGRPVITLERFVKRLGPRETTWRIVDTLVLPRYERDPDPRRPNALRLFQTGDCELDGKTDTYFIALVRWGKREKIDWRTGVERAWTFDIERERIVPLSTKRIVCYRPEPA